MGFIELFPVVISDDINLFGAALSACPGHVIAPEGDRTMAFRIVLPDLIRQHLCDFSSPFIRVHIIDLIPDGPHDHTGMAAVPPDPGGHVPLIPFREKPCIVIGCFGPFPHIKGFVNHQDTHLIAQIQPFLRGWVMARPHSVYAHILHQFQLPACCLFMKSRTECAQVMMQAYAPQPGLFAIQEQPFIRVSENRPQSDLPDFGLFSVSDGQHIEIGILRRPGSAFSHRDR